MPLAASSALAGHNVAAMLHEAVASADALLADHRGEFSGAGDAFYFDEVSPAVIELGRQAAFDVDACGGVLHEEIGSGNVVGDHAADADGIAESCFLGTELTDLIGVGEKGKRLRCRLSSGRC